MFKSVTNTNEWELGNDINILQPNIIINSQVYHELLSDSQILKALKQLGFITPNMKQQALALLKEQEDD